MSKTHTNDIIAAGKAVAKWIASRSGAVAGYDVRERINQRYPNYATSDKVGIMHGAMAVLRGKDPDTFRQYANYQASIKHDKVD